MSAFMSLYLTAGMYFPVAAGLRYKTIPDELRVVVTSYLRELDFRIVLYN